MLLAIDIGNTNVVLGVFEGERLRESWRIGTKASITADEYAVIVKDLFAFSGIDFRQIDGIIISTVVPPLLSIMTEMSRKYFKIEPLVVTSELKTGITLSYENPREIGADRIVNAAAAFRLYGGPLIIIDFGTATTFCAVTANGEYLGGAITPGVKISAEALYQRAAKLPRVELTRPRTIIGRDTVSAMQAGILYGYAGLVDGIVERMKKELSPDARVIATGGLAELVTPEARSAIEVRPNLTLEGLRFIFEANR
jgi:type III pantothenate kinase